MHGNDDNAEVSSSRLVDRAGRTSDFGLSLSVVDFQQPSLLMLTSPRNLMSRSRSSGTSSVTSWLASSLRSSMPPSSLSGAGLPTAMTNTGQRSVVHVAFGLDYDMISMQLQGR